MFQFTVLLLVLLLLWYMTPRTQKQYVLLPGMEPYENKQSGIQFTNAEFKFYK
jgi:hypothetical protein